MKNIPTPNLSLATEIQPSQREQHMAYLLFSNSLWPSLLI